MVIYAGIIGTLIDTFGFIGFFVIALCLVIIVIGLLNGGNGRKSSTQDKGGYTHLNNGNFREVRDGKYVDTDANGNIVNVTDIKKK